jgi:hypothetical protein
MGTILLTIAILGGCFLLLALRLLFVKDGSFRGTCSQNGRRPGEECAICPSAATCEERPVDGQEPKSSNAMFSLGTPRLSNIPKQDCSIAGGPHK